MALLKFSGCKDNKTLPKPETLPKYFLAGWGPIPALVGWVVKLIVIAPLPLPTFAHAFAYTGTPTNTLL